LGYILAKFYGQRNYNGKTERNREMESNTKYLCSKRWRRERQRVREDRSAIIIKSNILFRL
jgi:hypothetical protein